MKILILSFFIIVSSAEALEPVFFGPEFTFKARFAPQVAMSMLNARVRGHLIARQRKEDRFTELRTKKGAIKWISPNGWWFIPKMDQGVIEVVMKPGTSEYFRQYKDDMQDAIFASASNVDLFPQLFMGGGHMNISMSTFKDNPMLLRNFLVDLYNHNELFLGILNYDTNNALSFSLYTEATRKNMRDMIETFNFETRSIYQLFSDLNSFQQLMADPLNPKWDSSRVTRHKQFAVSFNHIKENADSARLEIRAIRPQASMDVWIRQIELIEGRLKYLEKMITPIPLQERVTLKPLDLVGDATKLNPPVDPQDCLRAFYDYVTESGQKWRDHTDYLWPKWLSDSEVTKFEKSDWFLERERQSSCAENLVVTG